MKITKRQLKRIIKEEKAKLLRESYEDDLLRSAPGVDKMRDFIAPMIADAWWEDKSADELEPGAPHPDELLDARAELENVIFQSGALKAIADLIVGVEERLRNGEFTR